MTSITLYQTSLGMKSISIGNSCPAGTTNFVIPLASVDSGYGVKKWTVKYVWETKQEVSLASRTIYSDVAYNAYGTPVSLDFVETAFSEDFTGAGMPAAITTAITRADASNYQVAVTVPAGFTSPVTMYLSIVDVQ